MNLGRRLLPRILAGLAALVLVATALAGALWLYFHPTVAGVRRVPYVRRVPASMRRTRRAFR